MNPIVVTGATGFVGKNLVPFLEKAGRKVVPLSLRDMDWKIKFPQEASAVIHLAGLAHDLRGASHPQDYFRINRDLTQEVFQQAMTSGAKKFIFMSSVKAAADTLGSEILTEDHIPAPGTPYGKSKQAAEHLLLAAAPNPMAVYILRPAMIHGPQNKGNLNLLYKFVASGIPYPFAAFENSRSFLSIDNLNFILAEICTRDIPSGIYNISDTERLSTRQVVEIIGTSLGRQGRFWRVNKSLVRGLARAGTILHFPFNEERLNKLTESYAVSNQKILDALGGELPVSAAQGMKRTFHSFAENRNGHS